MKTHSMKMTGVLSMALIMALTFSALGVTPTYAATLTVQSAADDGTTNAANCPGAGCRLRDAIAAAAAGDTITFNGNYTILLASELVINKNLTIDGGTHSVTVSGNHVTRVFNVTAGTVAFNHLTIANGNTQTYDCGGYSLKCGGGLILQNNSAIHVTVMDSAFSGNSASYGGGIDQEAGALTVTNSTFSGNSVDHDGGGIDQEAGALTVTNSAFSGNSAAISGGGIYNYSGTLTVTNSTFSGNRATYVGGIYNYTGTATLKNTIVANSPSGNNCFGTIGGANNLADDASCGAGFTNSASILLGALGNYGGSTQTFPLLPGSAAIDAGASAICSAAPVNNLDQRGAARPAACDIGAFESRGFTLTKTGGDSQSANINTAFGTTLGLSVTSAFSEPVDGGKVTFTPPGSGASASVTGSPATIAGCAVSVSVTANGTAGGPYNVVASASGATSVNFALTNNLPTPTASITNSPVTYTGSTQTATVACSGGGTATLASGGTGTNAGSYPATVDCAASANYAAATGLAAGNFVINPATQTVSVNNSPVTYDGTAKSATVGACSGGGTATNILTGGAISKTAAGTYAVTADCPAVTNYNVGTGLAAGNFVINPAMPVITWNNPASIVTGTALGGAQLNATANVAGAFIYTPAAGVVLPVGTHTLHVDFTPTDAVNYTNASKDVNITVTGGGGGGGGGLVPPTITASDGTYLDKVNVTWTPVSGASYYLVYRSESLGGVKIPTSGYRATSLGGDDVWTNPGVTYYYWVRACDAISCGEFSAPDTGWQGLPAPVISASDGAFPDKVQVTFPAVNWATSYLAYRSLSQDGVKIPNDGYFTIVPGGDDLWAAPGVTYYYWVKACNGPNCSALSAYDTGWR